MITLDEWSTSMARQAAHSDPNPVPMFPHETLYVGVDVGKFRHVAGMLSRSLLKRHERFEGCPTFTFDQSREGFRAFVERLCELVPIEQITVLLEHTGHYHRLLEQYLLDLDITVYRMHVQERPKGMVKTDKRDALSLANRLYTQLELGAKARRQNAVGATCTPSNTGGLSTQRIDPAPL
jgi:hypothetical protein